MEKLKISRHAALRMAQRGITLSDVGIIERFGTQVDDGYVLLNKDLVAVECALKKALENLRKLRGKRVVISDGCLVTAYHASRHKMEDLLKLSEERQLAFK